MDKARFDNLMAETGPLIAAAAITSLDDPSRWVIEFEDAEPCFVISGARETHLVLSGKVAELPAEGRLELYETMLLYNDQGENSGGARLAIDAADGAAILAVDLADGDLEPNRLGGLIGSFCALRTAWKEVLEQWHGDGADAEQAKLLVDLSRIV